MPGKRNVSIKIWWFQRTPKSQRLIGLQRKRHLGRIYDKSGKLILGIKEKKDQWVKYLETLFEDNRNNKIEDTNSNSGLI